MLKYYPLTRIIPNKYTRGNEFLLPNGTPYTGRYYITYDNKVYSGANPVIGKNELLTPIQKANVTNEYVSDYRNPTTAVDTLNPNPINVYNNVAKNAKLNARLTELTPYYPIPIESDYVRGYFTRYFAKNVSGPGYVIEISQLDWSKIKNGDIEDNVLGYETIDMLWQLTGPLNDTRVSQYQIQGGIYDTNKRVTESKQKGFNGIVEFIGGDYTKFARITS